MKPRFEEDSFGAGEMPRWDTATPAAGFLLFTFLKPYSPTVYLDPYCHTAPVPKLLNEENETTAVVSCLFGSALLGFI